MSPMGRAEHSALGSLLCADWCGADTKAGAGGGGAGELAGQAVKEVHLFSVVCSMPVCRPLGARP